MDISHVHIVFQRHAESISDVWDPALDGEGPKLEELQTLAEAITNPPFENLRFNGGDYKPDGLTGFGINCSEDFVTAITGEKDKRIDNVYMLVSSPLTRAFQTLQITQKALELVGPWHFGPPEIGNARHQPRIYLHQGLQEATRYPRNFPPAIKSSQSGRTASYIKIAGMKGRFKDAFDVISEQDVDVTTTIWPEENPYHLDTLEERMAVVLAPLDIPAIESACHSARVWLRQLAKEVLQIHHAERRSGVPKIFVTLHGGIINFVTERFYCRFERPNENVDWTWRSSAALKNLEINVYTFQSLEDDNASLKELDKDDQYSQAFGPYYRHMASNLGLVYENPDGTLIDQRLAHHGCLKARVDEVVQVAETQLPLLEALMNWTGARDFLIRQGERTQQH